MGYTNILKLKLTCYILHPDSQARKLLDDADKEKARLEIRVASLEEQLEEFRIKWVFAGGVMLCCLLVVWCCFLVVLCCLFVMLCCLLGVLCCFLVLLCCLVVLCSVACWWYGLVSFVDGVVLCRVFVV